MMSDVCVVKWHRNATRSMSPTDNTIYHNIDTIFTQLKMSLYRQWIDAKYPACRQENDGSACKCVGVLHHNRSWWRHQMEPFSALLAICAGNSPVTGEFPTQRPVTRSCDVFFDLRLNNGWVNKCEAGDLRHYRAHYDVIVMWQLIWNKNQAKSSLVGNSCTINMFVFLSLNQIFLSQPSMALSKAWRSNDEWLILHKSIGIPYGDHTQSHSIYVLRRNISDSFQPHQSCRVH